MPPKSGFHSLSLPLPLPETFFFVSRAILLETYLPRYMGCFKSPQICSRGARIFLGPRASKSLGLPRLSLSLRAAMTKNLNLANGGFTREERRGQDGELQKIPSGERDRHAASFVERSLRRRRRRQQRFWGSHVPSSYLFSSLSLFSLSCCLPSIHEFL